MNVNHIYIKLPFYLLLKTHTLLHKIELNNSVFKIKLVTRKILFLKAAVD